MDELVGLHLRVQSSAFARDTRVGSCWAALSPDARLRASVALQLFQCHFRMRRMRDTGRIAGQQSSVHSMMALGALDLLSVAAVACELLLGGLSISWLNLDTPPASSQGMHELTGVVAIVLVSLFACIVCCRALFRHENRPAMHMVPDFAIALLQLCLLPSAWAEGWFLQPSRDSVLLTSAFCAWRSGGCWRSGAATACCHSPAPPSMIFMLQIRSASFGCAARRTLCAISCPTSSAR